VAGDFAGDNRAPRRFFGVALGSHVQRVLWSLVTLLTVGPGLAAPYVVFELGAGLV